MATDTQSIRARYSKSIGRFEAEDHDACEALV